MGVSAEESGRKNDGFSHRFIKSEVTDIGVRVT